MIEDLETDIGDHHGSCQRCGESKVRTNLASRRAKEKAVVQCGPLIFVHEREVSPNWRASSFTVAPILFSDNLPPEARVRK